MLLYQSQMGNLGHIELLQGTPSTYIIAREWQWIGARGGATRSENVRPR